MNCIDRWLNIRWDLIILLNLSDEYKFKWQVDIMALFQFNSVPRLWLLVVPTGHRLFCKCCVNGRGAKEIKQWKLLSITLHLPTLQSIQFWQMNRNVPDLIELHFFLHYQSLVLYTTIWGYKRFILKIKNT